MEGKIQGSRCRGKQRRTWTSDVMDWVARATQNVLEWQKVDKITVPWQPNYLFADGTQSDSVPM